MLEHGGRLRAAARRHGIPLSDWLDLSTGIAPCTPPLPTIPPSAWMRLPEPDDVLIGAAQRYYGTDALLPVAGSQAAIQCLPRLRGVADVGVVSPCYGEHAQAWTRAGHRVLEFGEGAVRRAIPRLDVLVVVNPNNPTGRRLPVELLLQWHAELAEHGGWLVVDEAFVDCTPADSLVPHLPRPGLIVLRSFGKFFGLAGARLGFVMADPALLRSLDVQLGPWAVAGPARHLAACLLADAPAQVRQRERLMADGARLAGLLRRHDLTPTGGTALFQWVACEHAATLAGWLAERAILVRSFRHPASVRFGLPGDEQGWARLDHALGQYRQAHP
ncbi:threonine-phosphate decarboxylase CobD [Stutzerimonas urumqiensis]|uniref:threonine-phosphate decarboxylase CobD n=1 Tax=Stutzerimonas urumqiensis TaxID=638269 RepID=UPI000EB12B96|nr:threonine-phosphate decarboxylase CobD [Stutzerimonas urumqiensis]